jgi:dienelactone hydrolase
MIKGTPMSTFPSGGVDIQLEVFRPTGSGTFPAIVVAYGSRGVTPPIGTAIRDFAKALSDKGFVVAIPHYFERTGTPASDGIAGDAIVIEAFLSHRDTWIATIQDCVRHVQGWSDVKDDQIGLLAFSMGGHMALRLAKQPGPPHVKAVVEFFAPITQPPFNGLGGGLDKLPPVQIHQGEDDFIVVRAQSAEFETQLIAAGKVKGTDYEIYFYADEGHGFKSPTAIDDSTSRTIDFFKSHVK